MKSVRSQECKYEGDGVEHSPYGAHSHYEWAEYEYEIGGRGDSFVGFSLKYVVNDDG